MNIDEINVFLAIEEERNLTKAAEKLFLSQPTVSNRLKSLENSLSMQLVMRRPGTRTIELTYEGRQFLPIAKQWAALNGNISRLRHQEKQATLCLGCPDTLSDGFFLPLFRKLMYDAAPIRLSIATYHSQNVVQAVANRSVDIGLGFYQRSYPNVIARQLFYEKLAVVLVNPSAAVAAKKEIHPVELNRKDEFYIYWSPEFQQWHDSWWDQDEAPFAAEDTLLQIKELMTRQGQWAVIPYYLANSFRFHPRFAVKSLSVASSERICYMFRHRYPDPHTMDAAQQLEKAMLAYCAKYLFRS